MEHGAQHGYAAGEGTPTASLLENIQDSDQLKLELDNMLGSLSLELEELVCEVNGKAEIASSIEELPKKRQAKTVFMKPATSVHLKARPIEDDTTSNMSISDDEDLTAVATDELKTLLKSASSNTSLSVMPAPTDQAAVVAGDILRYNGDVVVCTMEEFLAEDNGFEESDGEEAESPASAPEPDQPAISQGGYWSSVGSYAAAGWGLATASLVKATELSKSSIAATKATITGKVSSLKADPELISRNELVNS